MYTWTLTCATAYLDAMDGTKTEPTIPTYRAAQAPDGTWTIFDVPVFAAHTEERSERDLEFSESWLSGALAKSATRQAEGYLAPLHVSHHGEGEPVEAAGKFRLTRVGDIQHGGEPVKALFADLVGVRPEVYERIRAGELSYRSVEILDVSEPEIDSLALLDDEVPFFRFPLLRVAEDKDTFPQGAAASALFRVAGAGQPILAYSARGRRSASLFRFQEQPMTQPHTGAAPASDPTKKMGNPKEVIDMLMSGLQQLAAMVGASEAPANGPGPVEQPAPAAPMAQPKHPMAPQPVGMTRGFSAHEAERDGENQALKDQFKALRVKFAALEASGEINAKAAELTAKGFSVETIASFRAKADDQGVQAALHYAAGLERLGAPTDPPMHWSGEIRSEAPDPAVVSKFAAQGPEALNRAREYHASWRRSGSTVPFEDYYAANTDADAYVAAGRKE